ncbi:MAG: pirin family protein [Planctomycetes bacterium]|jgi:redox-sensitive bicupin YhaK (pirin superfamily)|nr:pirin family protein [Planctomycetota bacterium]MCL4731332.1 pirin family protein [Planctomycetota bacterium]
MITIRRSAERGHYDHGWLKTAHTFSFADYHDPRHHHFRALRVMNEDVIAGGGGFPMHPHRDMEIITYVLEGRLEHRDSLGNRGLIAPGIVQRMSAGRGIVHSEYNASATQPVHLYQIWLLPNARGLEPGYEERALPGAGETGRLKLVASPDGAQGSLRVHADARLYAATLAPGDRLQHVLGEGRAAWLQVMRGDVNVGGQTSPLVAGDGAAVTDQGEIALASGQGAELLLFDLA